MVDDHYEPLLSYAHFLLGHREQVEDVVQQAFMLAFDRLADSQAFRGNPWKWLRGTVRNLVYDVWRQPRRLLQDVADLLHQVVLEADEAGDGMDRSRVREALRRCLDTLGEGDRRLIDQRYEKGWRIFKIARQMKISLWPNLLHRATGRPRCITPNQEGTLKPGDNQIVLKIRGAAAVLGTSDAVRTYLKSKGLRMSNMPNELSPDTHVVVIWNATHLREEEKRSAKALCDFAGRGGRILFCQLDLQRRVGRSRPDYDPVAERVLLSLLDGGGL